MKTSVFQLWCSKTNGSPHWTSVLFESLFLFWLVEPHNWLTFEIFLLEMNKIFLDGGVGVCESVFVTLQECVFSVILLLISSSVCTRIRLGSRQLNQLSSSMFLPGHTDDAHTNPVCYIKTFHSGSSVKVLLFLETCLNCGLGPTHGTWTFTDWGKRM